MNARFPWCAVLLLAAAAGGWAQANPSAGSPLPGLAPLMTRETEETPAAPPAPPPGSALEQLERQIQRNPPPLEPPGPPLDGPILTVLVSVGCAGLALIPTIQGQGPEDEPGEYLGAALFWGVLQGSLLQPFAASGLLLLPPSHPDLRTEWGGLLDLEEAKREQRAYRILRERATRAKRRRIAGALLTVGLTALPAGAYYLGSALVGPNPNVRDIGVGYVVGIALGSLPWALLFLAVKSEDERILAELESAARPGGAP